ncbi:hypothetical protein ACWF94_33660, partial [Streptomyces sp. NPDC055078]
VDLTNTTDRACRDVHPVIVFAGAEPGLTPARLRVEFYDEGASRWRPSVLETTTEDEVVAVLDGEPGDPGDSSRAGRGFAVPARSTVTVRVRLALAAGTPANEVTVNAAIVQRRGDDGDWVGESGDHHFTVPGEHGPGATAGRDELATTGSVSPFRLGAALGTVLLGAGVLALVSRRLNSGRP